MIQDIYRELSSLNVSRRDPIGRDQVNGPNGKGLYGQAQKTRGSEQRPQVPLPSKTGRQKPNRGERTQQYQWTVKSSGKTPFYVSSFSTTDVPERSFLRGTTTNLFCPQVRLTLSSRRRSPKRSFWDLPPGTSSPPTKRRNPDRMEQSQRSNKGIERESSRPLKHPTIKVYSQFPDFI